MELFDGFKYRISRDGNTARLVVKNVADADAGDITCEVRNRKGGESATAKLKVQSEFHRFFSDDSPAPS